MRRCIQLAKLGSGEVAPNPMVGAVLVHQDRIIGEGYHQQYGAPHAEVNCITSVKNSDGHLIQQATLYVSLEPCSHWGKTPPCADLIIEKKISKVVIGCRDPFIEVNGKGIEKLQLAGLEVTTGMLETECRELNKRFFTFHERKGPYIILKWAQTANNKIGNEDHSRLLITNDFTNRIVHKWRSEEASIAVGTNTALYDDPQLNVRLWLGKNPIRIVVDMNLRLPKSLQLFNEEIPTIIFNKHQHSLPSEKNTAQHLKGVQYYQVTEDVSLIHQMVNGLYTLGIQSVLIEGGAQLLQSFIDEGIWDEARIISNGELIIADGLPAPQLTNGSLIYSQTFSSDTIRFYQPQTIKVP